MKKARNLVSKKPTATIIGLGYVGSAVLRAAAETDVYLLAGLDLDPHKIEELQTDQTLYQVKLTTEAATCLSQSSIIVICVPTPIDAAKQPDLRFLEAATKTVAQHLKKGQLIILESTVAPGYSEEVTIPWLETTGLKVGQDVGYAYCPERIDVNNTHWDITKIPRVVAASDEVALGKTLAFYEHFIQAPLHVLPSLKEAEFVKMYENTFRDVNIALANEMAVLASKLGVDINRVIAGAATKPFGFLAHVPGCGVGGDCIATDPYYLLDTARQSGLELPLIEAARQRNETMPRYMVNLLDEFFNTSSLSARSAKVLVLGVAYKAEISDTRRSPGIEVIKLLREQHFSIDIFDPFAPQDSTVSSLVEGLERADIVLLCTAHREFVEKLTPRLLHHYKIKCVVDGRNCLDKDGLLLEQIFYKGIGR